MSRVNPCVIVAMLAFPAVGAAQCEREWLPGGGIAGVRGTVAAMCTHDLGAGERLFAGGRITAAGGEAAYGMAVWDGMQWSGTGPGLRWNIQTGNVSALTGFGSLVVAGGQFDQAGGQPMNNVAAWNGAEWTPLGSGLPSSVAAMAVFGGDLYAATLQNAALGEPSPGIWRWDGQVWQDIAPPGTLDTTSVLSATAMTVFQDRLVVAYRGNDEINFQRLAAWDGATWFPFTASPDINVRSLSVFNNQLFCGGTQIEPSSAVNVRRWTGTEWATLPGLTFPISDPAPVYGLFSFGGKLWISGDFPWSSSSRHDLWAWNGNQWSLYGTVSGSIYSFAAYAGRLHVGGNLGGAGSVGFEGVAAWDNGWIPLGEGANGGVRAFCRVGQDLFVGGGFERIGGIAARAVARWDGRDWYRMDSGLSGYLNRLVHYGGEVFAIGDFTHSSNGVSSPDIARWNGTRWAGVGRGMNGLGWNAVAYGPDLYVCGRFTRVDSTLVARNIAKWNGTAWSTLNTTSGPVVVDNDVWALAVYEGDLIVGGLFRQPTRAIGRYNGQTWEAISPAQPLGEVEAAAVHKGELYIAGTLRSFGDPPLNGVARWNGSSWEPVGNGIGSLPLVINLESTPHGLVVTGQNLRLGASDESDGEVRAALLWNGTEWVDLVGDAESVFAVSGDNAGLIAGGYFDEIGGVRASRFAEWRARLDTDRSGAITLADFFLFLADFFQGSAAADWNRDGQTGVEDVFAYLSEWFSGC